MVPPEVAYDYKIDRPLLAADAKTLEALKNLRYPLLGSMKIDGIRCLTLDHGFPVTRSFKPIPNRHIQKMLERVPLYLDGELVALDDEWRPKDFTGSVSDIMTRDGTPRVCYMVFDTFHEPDEPYEERSIYAHLKCEMYNDQYSHDETGMKVTYLRQHRLNSYEDAMEMFVKAKECGFEGIMLRDPSGVYKSGRSTLKQQILVKYKGLETSEAEGIVIDFEELMYNHNEAVHDAFGLQVRSSHKANLEPAGILGALVLSTKWGILRVGTGFDMQQREMIWNNRSTYFNQIVTFTYQDSGMKDLPRFPVFKRFRHPDDMGGE